MCFNLIRADFHFRCDNNYCSAIYLFEYAQKTEKKNSQPKMMHMKSFAFGTLIQYSNKRKKN